MILELQNLTISFPPAGPVFRDLTVGIEAGSCLGVCGVNGSGKTTLALAIRGLLRELYNPLIEGEIRYKGQPVHAAPSAGFLGEIGLVLQRSRNQLSGIAETVFDEVAFGLENQNVPPEKVPRRVYPVLEQLGLASLADRHPRSLSGGQMRRLAIASVLVLEPGLLILDEPFSQLDPQSAHQVLELLMSFRDAGATLVVCDNLLDYLIPLVDQCLVLIPGQPALCAPGTRLLESPEWSATSLKRPDFAELAWRARQEGMLAGPLPSTREEALKEWSRPPHPPETS